MNVMIFGATGMVGSGVLIECIEDPSVDRILSITRTPGDFNHEKLREIIHRDFFDYSAISDDLAGFDACFFCLGVSAAGKSEAEYHRLTCDLTLAAARSLVEINPQMTFCYVSGLGTDSTEKGRIMWARVKGETENHLLDLPFKAAYMFRPGFIQPQKGVRSKTALYRAVYALLSPFYPLLQRFFPNQVTSSVRVGRAMIRVAAEGYPDSLIETGTINAIALQRT